MSKKERINPPERSNCHDRVRSLCDLQSREVLWESPAKNRPCSLKNPSVNPQIHPNTRWSIRHNQWYHKVPNLESRGARSPGRPLGLDKLTSLHNNPQDAKLSLAASQISTFLLAVHPIKAAVHPIRGSGAGSGARLLITPPVQFLHVNAL